MSAPNVRDLLRLPGRLCVEPSSLTSDFPHGGTALGIVRDAIFRFGIKTSLVTAEEFGGVPVEATYAGEVAILACVLRGIDNDAVAKIFPNSVAGSSSGDRIVQGRVSGSVNRAGTLLSSKAVKLLWSPKAADHHRFVYFPKAIPAVDESAEMQMSLSEEIGIAVMFYAIPDSTGRLYDVGKREDLTL